MTTSFPYAFQPQPPSHPRTHNAGKRGSSLPIAILSTSDDSESDVSITDFSPPSNGRQAATESTKVSVPLLPSPRGLISNKKSSLSVPHSPRPLVSTNGTTNLFPAANINLHSTNNGTSQNILGTNSITSSGSSSILPPTTSLLSSSSSPSSSSSLPSSSSSSSSSPISLQLPSAGIKTLPPTITIPLQTAVTHTNTTGIPALTSSAVSPTTSSHIPLLNCNNSSHDSHKENASPRHRSCSPNSNFAYEHDHDYDNVASPCSSTASGPTYVRPDGFQHHAQEFIIKTKPKKKKMSANLINLREGYKKRESTPPKLKPKREPLPMKLRALPQSFWQQPNVTQQVSPASNFPILPPLCNKDTEEAMDERPVTPPDEREAGHKVSERKLTVANPDLLFKLFEGIGDEKKSQTRSKQMSKQKKVVVKSNTNFIFSGNDPYLMEDVTEKIFPQLSLEGRKPITGGGNACLQLITLKDGDRDVMLPSLSMEQNYPQLLSELVMHI